MFNFKPILATGLAAAALFAIISATTSLAKTPVKVTYASQTVSAEQAIASGSFSGLSDHITTGKASIVKAEQGYQLVLAADFELDGAPDPVVGFGNAGKYVKASQIADLKNKRGAQTYQLPADFNPANFSEVYIYCEKFSVPLGVAPLN